MVESLGSRAILEKKKPSSGPFAVFIFRVINQSSKIHGIPCKP